MRKKFRASASTHLSRTEASPALGRLSFETRIKRSKSSDYVSFKMPTPMPETTTMNVHRTEELDGTLFSCIDVYDGYGKLKEKHLYRMEGMTG